MNYETDIVSLWRFLSGVNMQTALTQNITCKKCQKIFQAPFKVDRRNVRGSGMTMCPSCGHMVSMTL